MADLVRGGVSRRSLALRGLVGVVLLLVAVVLSVVGGAGMLETDPSVTSKVPAAAGPVRPNSAVRYRGVVVGELSEVESGARGSQLTLRMDPSTLGSIPSGVRLRILPKTLFGDQYVELATASPASAQGRLRPGSVVEADTSAGTVQLYRAYTRMYDLLVALRPAELQVALTTMADVLRGRGAELGHTIDTLHGLSGRFDPAELGGHVPEIAGLSKQMAAAAPDMLATLDDAVALSRTVVDKRQNLTDLLDGGTALTAQSQRLLDDNAGRAIQVVHTLRPASEVLGGGAHQLTETLHNLEEFSTKANRTFTGGRFQIRAPLTLEDPHPYTAEDCPRYPGLDGPNCRQRSGAPAPAYGGAIGPIGSAQEKGALAQLFPHPPGGPAPSTPDPRAPGSTAAAPDTDLMGLLFGPVVRGTQVVVP